MTLSVAVELGMQMVAITSDRVGQHLSFAFALRLLVIGEGFAIAEEPLQTGP